MAGGEKIGEPGLKGKLTPKYYALSVIGGSESRVAAVLAERARTLGLDLRSIIVPSEQTIKGVIIVEVGDPKDLFEITRGVRNVKRKRPIPISEEDAMKLARPIVEIPELQRGQIVEIIAGPFKGMKGRVIEVHEARGEVDLTLLESDFRMVVTIHLDQVKPVEEEG